MIPAFPINSISVGPLTIHIYGVLIALAIIACYKVITKIAPIKGFTTSQIETLFLTVLPVAFIGARIYHLITNWNYYLQNPLLIPAIWNGGLGIIGGILGSFVAIYFLSKKFRIPFLQITDLLAVALPLGHAIGRWGNYVNQELFGRPTSLPWAVYIDPNHRPVEYKNNATFHPTFLYESLFNLLNFTLLYFLYTRKKIKTGTTTGLYLLNYGIIRFIIELVKIDPDTSAHIGPLRIPQYFSITFILLGLSIVFITYKKSYK